MPALAVPLAPTRSQTLGRVHPAARTGARLRWPCWILGLCALLAPLAVAAATVYRWVDDEGKVHYADVVPERYRDTARPLNTPSDEPSPEQRRQAAERAERDKARAAAIPGARGRPPPPTAASAPSALAARRPAQIPTEQTDCDTWQRLYRESLDCFGPFRTVRGATRPEAFAVCNEVPEPPPTRCRPRLP